MPIALYTYAKIAKIINDINIKNHDKYKIIIYEINMKIIINNNSKNPYFKLILILINFR